MSASQRCCQRRCGVDARAHIKTCMAARVRVHPGLCHGTGMPSHDRGEQAAWNELDTTAQALMVDSTRSINRGAFAVTVSLGACFPRQGACLMFMVDTQAVWGWQTPTPESMHGTCRALVFVSSPFPGLLLHKPGCFSCAWYLHIPNCVPQGDVGNESKPVFNESIKMVGRCGGFLLCRN